MNYSIIKLNNSFYLDFYIIVLNHFLKLHQSLHLLIPHHMTHLANYYLTFFKYINNLIKIFYTK